MGLVAHKHKKLALVLLEDGQDLRQLACLHRDKHDVIAFLRGQRFNGRHTVHSRFELGPVADGEAFLVDPLFPLAPRQQSHRVFSRFVPAGGPAHSPCTPAPYTKILMETHLLQ